LMDFLADISADHFYTAHYQDIHPEGHGLFCAFSSSGSAAFALNISTKT